MEPRFFNHGDPLTNPLRPTARTRRVSMEPRFFNHGDRIFSGASSASRSDVSMEPRFFNHGDSLRRLQKRLGDEKVFQWSHGFSTMEP